VNAWQCVCELADEIVPFAGTNWFLARLAFLDHNSPSVLEHKQAQATQVWQPETNFK